jgi:hypothetical protein
VGRAASPFQQNRSVDRPARKEKLQRVNSPYPLHESLRRNGAHVYEFFTPRSRN